MLAEKAIFYKTNCQDWAACINLLRPLLDELQENKMPLSGEELSTFDMMESTFLKMKELLEKCTGKASKSILVLQKQQVLKSFQELSLELHSLLRSLPLKIHLPDHCQEEVEQCANCLQTPGYRIDGLEGGLSEEVESALKEIKRGVKMSHGILVKFAGKLDLKSNQEILRELSLLEKEKNKAHSNKDKGEEELLNLLIVLVTQMGDDLAEQKQVQAQKGGIPIPPDFRCPLSLELMSDPVIVASGQTYERAYIQQWLDQGNTTCPKSRQTLSHLNLIPNYTVKALITTWCEGNGVSLPESEKLQTTPSQLFPSINSNVNHKESVLPLPAGSSAYSDHPIASTGGRRPNVRSVRTIRIRSRENFDMSRREAISPIGSLDENRGFLLGNSRAAAVGESDIHCPPATLSVEGENSMDGTQSHSRNDSTSSFGSSVGDNNNIENTTLSLPNDSSPYVSDASGELDMLTVASLPSRSEENGSGAIIADHGSVSRGRRTRNGGSELSRIVPSDADMVGDDENNVQLRVQALVRDLQSSSRDAQRNAARELRLLAKYNVENRIIIANSEAIAPLVSLLHSTDPDIQENAVTALLNLSINDNNKSEIAAANAIDPLVHVLRVGTSDARENAAATLFSLSVMDDNKVTIGQSGAIAPLVELLMHGTPRGKKDAATALFNLSILHENKVRIVRANAVKPLVILMSDPAAGMVDKAVAVLSNLATIQEGRIAIGEEQGIPALVEVVELGSQRGKENAAAALLHLCTSNSRFRAKVLQEGVIPPLVALTKSGTARAKEKASALLRLFREQRQGRGGANMHADRRR